MAFEKYKEFNKMIENKNQESKLLDAKIAQEVETIGVFSVMEKYGDLYKKLALTSAIDYCMRLTPTTEDKISQLEYVKGYGLVDMMGLYKDGLIIKSRSGDTTIVESIHSNIDEYSSIQLKLKTDERHNDCHNGSCNLMEELGKFSNKRLVTGFIKGACEDSKYLHTWIEFDDNGKEKVADYTLNAIMDKDFYYGLRSVDEKNKCEISEEDFKSEKDKIRVLINAGELGIRSYLYFRDELINGENQR